MELHNEEDHGSRKRGLDRTGEDAPSEDTTSEYLDQERDESDGPPQEDGKETSKPKRESTPITNGNKALK